EESQMASAAVIQAGHEDVGRDAWSSRLLALPWKGINMAIFRVGFFSGFDCGYDAVLVGADRNGMRMLQSAVRSAHDDGAASFEFDAIKHHVVRQDGAADIELGSQAVVWRFDDAQLVEMLDLIEPLVDTEGAGHQYVDLNSPA